MSDFEGQAAIVTGAASGIGRATAERLAAGGARVVAADIDASALAWTQDHDALLACPGDVTSADFNRAMVEACRKEFGRLDALILNAGISANGSIQDMDLELFSRVMDVNVRGVVLGLQAALPLLRADGAGSVVVTASISGLAGDPGMWPYNVSKGAVANLVRAASLDLAHEGIRVNGICPGPIHTGMTDPAALGSADLLEALRRNIPLQRIGEASEAAELIAFLASSRASFITGTLIPVDGGISANSGALRPIETDGISA